MIAVRETKPLLAFDSAFPQREEILCAGSMAENFSKTLKKQVESCEIVRVKYRPETSLRVLYRVKIENENSLFSARVFTANRAREIYEKTENEKAIFYAKNLQTIFWKFPFDRKIKQLNKVFSSGCKGEIVAYAPEKCATVCYSNIKNEPFAYAKIFADKREGERIFSVYKKLPKTEEKLFPNAVCYSPKHQTLIVEAVKGARLADLQNEDLENAFRLFGAAVARFHEIEPLENLKKFSRHKPQKISETLETIKNFFPEHFAQAEKLAAQLNQNFDFDAEEKVTLHGDVHAKNAILFDGGNLTLIDLDQTSFGNPASDIGSFLAGLFYKEITGEISANERKILTENFLLGYEKTRVLQDEKTLRRFTATAIFTERAARAINRFRIGGLKNFSAILTCAENFLNGEIL